MCPPAHPPTHSPADAMDANARSTPLRRLRRLHLLPARKHDLFHLILLAPFQTRYEVVKLVTRLPPAATAAVAGAAAAPADFESQVERQTPPFLVLPLLFCPRRTPLLVVLLRPRLESWRSNGGKRRPAQCCLPNKLTVRPLPFHALSLPDGHFISLPLRCTPSQCSLPDKLTVCHSANAQLHLMSLSRMVFEHSY